MIEARKIRDLGKELNVELRITQARPFDSELDILHDQMKNGLFLESEYWNGRALNTFYDPQFLFKSCRTIIAGCLGYLTEQEPDPSSPGKPYGSVAQFTQRNYYKELRRRLKKIGKFLRKEYHADYFVSVCGRIAEKPIAQRSGIGYFGKHTIIINKDYGSWIVLGEIVTDLEIEPDEPLDIDCGTCRKCIDACPTKAIIRPYVLDRKRCIQALSNHNGSVPDDIAKVWGSRVYGCTACQDACPLNQKIKPAAPQTAIGVVGQYLPLLDILEMDEKEYRGTYADNQISAGWINFPAIQRNALLCLGNIGDEETLPVVRKYAQSSDPLLSHAALWALGRFK